MTTRLAIISGIPKGKTIKKVIDALPVLGYIEEWTPRNDTLFVMGITDPPCKRKAVKQFALPLVLYVKIYEVVDSFTSYCKVGLFFIYHYNGGTGDSVVI